MKTNPSPSEHISVFRPNQRHEHGLLHTWTVMARNVWASRELIWQLFRRDLVAQYKRSFVGIAWMFVGPLMGIIPWVFAYKTDLYRPGELDIPFPVYILVGKSVWGIFNGFYGAASSTLGAAKPLVQQVNFPREAMLFKATAQAMPGLLFTIVTNIVVMACFGMVPSVWALTFPLAILPLFFLGAAMGLMVSMIRVVAFDLDRIIGILMGFLMWTTPLLYSNKVPSPLIQAIIKWNPLTYLVCSCRDLFIYGRFYEHNAEAYFAFTGVTLILFLVSWRLFYVSEDKLVERMI